VSPERIVAAVLSALAATLIVLVVLGPTEGADATAAPTGTPTTEPGTTEAVTSTESAQTEPAPETTTEAVEAPTSTEAVPAEPPQPAGDGTLPRRIRMTLDGEYDWEIFALGTRAKRLQIELRATALQGGDGDDHGVECGTADAIYSATVAPWTGDYLVLRWNTTRSRGIEMGKGTTAALARPPKPNVLRLTCVALRQGEQIVLAANGKRIASLMDTAVAGGFETVGVTANDVGQGLDVVFDRIVVETG
jgi:hypothetical protein